MKRIRERKHIFLFTPSHYKPRDADGGSGASVLSDRRSSGWLFIEIDLRTALADGIPFYVASNGVVVTEGIDGVLPPRYFKRVTDSFEKLIE